VLAEEEQKFAKIESNLWGKDDLGEPRLFRYSVLAIVFFILGILGILGVF